MTRKLLETDQKALEINLDDQIYGTFAEIGAGQEVARYFFQVGAAAGTIAKTMSAYDKIVSDKIYGTEQSRRYVCQERIYKMLGHEYDLMQQRLRTSKPNTNFFVFADTIAAINYTRTIKGNGWLGLRFQLDPNEAPNDFVLHVKMLDNDNKLQQQAIGKLGVNMVYACYRYHHSPERMVKSLMDGLEGRIAIDMVRLSGPNFSTLDNRLLSLWLVKNGLTKVCMFGPDKQNIHASEFLYRKNTLIVRGSFRPITHVNWDMLQTGWENFTSKEEVDPSQSFRLAEITLENLKRNSELEEIDETDFLHRADLLADLDQTVVLTASENHTHLINYLKDFKVPKIGILIGIRDLMMLVEDIYKKNVEGSLLEAFGKLFSKKVQMYVYPSYQEGSSEVMNIDNVPIPEGVKFLFKHLQDSKQIINIENYRKDILHIYSKEVLQMIRQDEEGWEEKVPERTANLIKKDNLFGYPLETLEFKY